MSIKAIKVDSVSYVFIFLNYQFSEMRFKEVLNTEPWLTPNSKLKKSPKKLLVLNHSNGKTNGLIYIKNEKHF